MFEELRDSSSITDGDTFDLYGIILKLTFFTVHTVYIHI